MSEYREGVANGTAGNRDAANDRGFATAEAAHGRLTKRACVRLARAARAGSGMTQPTDPPAQVEDRKTHELQQDSGLQPAAGVQAHHDKKQQSGWLRGGSEVVHAPGTRFPSRQTIGLSTLAIVMSGLAVAAISHFLAPGPVTSQITARPAAAQPQVPPIPVATKEASAAAPEVPAGPASPVLAAAEPKPEQHTPIAGDTTEYRSHGPHQALASPPSPTPALPDKTAASWPSREDDDQADTAQPAPPSQDQQPQWHWKKTTTCDSSGRCVDHYNPAPEGDDDTAQPAPPSQDQQRQWHWKKTTTCDSSGRCVDHYNPAPSGQ